MSKITTNENLVKYSNQTHSNEFKQTNNQLKKEKMSTKTTKENLVNNSNKTQWKPSKKWFKTYRRKGTDQCLINKIEELLETGNWMNDMIDVLDDNEFLLTNYPSFTKNEVEDYLSDEYEHNSKFVFRLKKFLNNESLKMITDYSKLSDEQKEWNKENLDW